MITITFSHRYVKMPLGVEHLTTFIASIELVDFNFLTAKQIKEDTEIVGGGYYPLRPGQLIWIHLWSLSMDGKKEWGTMRSYTPEKYSYYKREIGKEVKIAIDPEYAKKLSEGRRRGYHP